MAARGSDLLMLNLSFGFGLTSTKGYPPQNGGRPQQKEECSGKIEELPQSPSRHRACPEAQPGPPDKAHHEHRRGRSAYGRQKRGLCVGHRR